MIVKISESGEPMKRGVTRRFLRIDDMLGYILDRTGLISLIHEEPAFILLFAFAQLPVVLWAFVSLTRKLRDRKFIMTAS